MPIPRGHQLSKLVNSWDKKVLSKHPVVALEFFRIGKKNLQIFQVAKTHSYFIFGKMEILGWPKSSCLSGIHI